MTDDLPTPEDCTRAHRELLEHVRDVDDDLAPIAEEILAELPDPRASGE